MRPRLESEGALSPMIFTTYIAQNRGHLDIGILPCLLNALSMLGFFPGPAAFGLGKRPEILDRLRRNKASPDQPVRQKVRLRHPPECVRRGSSKHQSILLLNG